MNLITAVQTMVVPDSECGQSHHPAAAARLGPARPGLAAYTALRPHLTACY